eukprot:3493146-Rhodomonas_salina.1
MQGCVSCVSQGPVFRVRESRMLALLITGGRGRADSNEERAGRWTHLQRLFGCDEVEAAGQESLSRMSGAFVTEHKYWGWVGWKVVLALRRSSLSLRLI